MSRFSPTRRATARLAAFAATTLITGLVALPSARAAVPPAELTLAVPSGSVAAGEKVSVEAKVSAPAKDAFLLIKLFRSADCTGTSVADSSGQTFKVPSDATGGTFTFSYRTGRVGPYSWQGILTEDATTTTKCSEDIAVGKATPAVSTVATNAAAGEVIQNTATLSGRVSPDPAATSSITFVIYASEDTTCETPKFASTSKVSTGENTYLSAPIQVAAPGKYRWKVTYAGDENNAAVTVDCGVGTSTVTAKATPPPPPAPTPTCQGVPATIVGTKGANTITGTKGNDVIVGRAGNDKIDGRGGTDTICGDAGKDVLVGGTGADEIRGGTGDDELQGNSGNDYLLGEGNNDTLTGGSGDDRLNGGSGKDTLAGGKGKDVGNGGTGKDTFSGVERASN